MSRIPGTTESVDASGVRYVWAGHVSEAVAGDGTAECEAMVRAGILDDAEVDTCECGCTDGRCYVYRVIDPARFAAGA